LEQYPILRNAPITEALIDIRVKLPPQSDVKKIDSMHDLIKNQYPKKQEQRMSEIKVELKPGEETAKQLTKINGFRFLSSDEKQIVQARMDGFTFNKLFPYTKWEDLRNEARRLWLIYREIACPDLVTRVALRYINNLKIPMPIKDFDEYLVSPPGVPEELPQGVSSFLSRVVIHEPSVEANAIITQALESVVGEVVPIILDIDVFKLRPEGIEEDGIWSTLENLRIFKNRIFFASITKKLKEMLQ
jgi:uncharacterized protein (TIGR04255 family)